MRATSLELQNFRSFESMGPISLDQVNVLIGPNNAGKTSILKALHLIQVSSGNIYPDVRVGNTNTQVTIGLVDIQNIVPWGDIASSGLLKIIANTADRISGNISLNLTGSPGGNYNLGQLPNIVPNHFIVPYLSKRKTATYHEDVRMSNALQVSTGMEYLSAKLARIANPEFPGYMPYSKTCKAILGFVVTAIPSANGQRPGAYLPNGEPIFIDQMGEGVPNIVALLAELALAKGKLFLIEEPENDIHPQALKALLDLIVESSKSNQFVVSTHSNIVVRHLAALANSKLYNITTELGKMPPVARIRAIEPTVEARLDVLRELGYSFSDFDLWDGWLILEESSAERIIRDYLIPWFVPRLARVRTLAVGGVNQVEPTFDDFHRLVRFTHLEEAYQNAAWVRVDGDKVGSEIISRLQERYSTWKSDRFGCFSKAQFENYYPLDFAEQINEVLALTERPARREAKRKLLNEVRAWLDKDEQRGRAALAKSAADVISDLKLIESQIK